MKTKKERKIFAASMRKHPTEAEDALDREIKAKNAEREIWRAFGKKRLKYKRQVLKHGYILDFYFPAYRTAVEVDGSSHKNRGDYDERRDKRLSSIGIKTIRVTNDDVLNNPIETVDSIFAEILTRTPIKRRKSKNHRKR